jgi:hypothetical protein
VQFPGIHRSIIRGPLPVPRALRREMMDHAR